EPPRHGVLRVEGVGEGRVGEGRVAVGDVVHADGDAPVPGRVPGALQIDVGAAAQLVLRIEVADAVAVEVGDVVRIGAKVQELVRHDARLVDRRVVAHA